MIRDKPTGRYLDRDKVHYIDFEGPFFSVRGPSITPRSPQGQPLIFIDVRDEPSRALAAKRADVVLVDDARRERRRSADAAAVLVKRPIERGDAVDPRARTGHDHGRRLPRRARLARDVRLVRDRGRAPRRHHQPGITLARPLRPRPPREPVRVVKQIHLAAHFPGVNNTTVWSDPDSGSQTDFSSFVHLAESAERGKFDFFFLAEGLRLREHRGRIFDLDVVGRPDSLTVLAALAAVTDRIGLAATLNTTFNEPFELARQFATLDHLSNGRAAWNAVTSPDAFTGENFRRAGFLPRDDRYERAAEFIEVARELWDSHGTQFEHHGDQFDIEGSVRRAGQSPGLPGDDPGGRLRRRPRARGQARRRHLHPALGLRRRPGVLSPT